MNLENNHSQMNDFNVMSKIEALVWIKHILLEYSSLMKEDMLQDLNYMDPCINDQLSISLARKKAFEIHAKAKLSHDLNQVYLYRAIAHGIATYHVKEHALKSLYYLNKVK